MKPYQKIPIVECGEPLVPIPLEQFAVEFPHPYEKLGAPYGKVSPYYLRQSVLTALLVAQTQLQQRYYGWHIQIFDAYRPIAVQQFMVDHTFAEALRVRNLAPDSLSPQQQDALWQEVYQLWAVPSPDPATPPPHSTGAAIDVTLVDAAGQTLNMGSAIDELSPRSHPDYYSDRADLPYHSRRQLLREVMELAGFCRHRGEWWHFSLGDQMWAWLCRQENPAELVVARYGRIGD